MIETKELTVLKTQVSRLENEANELSITTPEENAFAIELKAKLRDMGKTIKGRKEEITVPLNEALRSARNLFAPIEERYETAESVVSRKLLAYKQKVDAEARAKEEKIAKQLGQGRLKLETAERKISEVQRVEKTIQTNHGQVQFRKIKKVRITNQDLIPDEYWVVDEIKLRKEALAGKSIAGCEVYEEETV